MFLPKVIAYTTAFYNQSTRKCLRTQLRRGLREPNPPLSLVVWAKWRAVDVLEIAPCHTGLPEDVAMDNELFLLNCPNIPFIPADAVPIH